MRNEMRNERALTMKAAPLLCIFPFIALLFVSCSSIPYSKPLEHEETRNFGVSFETDYYLVFLSTQRWELQMDFIPDYIFLVV